MKNKIVLVTGGSRGIGASTCRLLQKTGYKILAPSRQELNLADSKSINNFIKENKNLKLYALINNAAVNNPAWIDEVTDENIFETIQVNLIAPILLIHGFVPALKKNKIAHIVNVSSMFGIVARGKQVLYSATKAGLNGATKALALELAQFNILVNSICPGFVDTDLTRRNTLQKNRELAREVPLGRFAKAEEIANLIAFLISGKNTYITGETIIIDGGYTAR